MFIKAPFGTPAISAIFVSAMLIVGGCTDSGGAQSNIPPTNQPPPPPPPTGGGPAYTPGIFQAASQFKDRCEVVRTGVDIEGNPFPDLAGSTAEENFYLRSWTNETYLWNTEVVDRNPNDFNDRLAYFALLKTTATTPSGRDKDEFHFTQSTQEFLEARNSAPLSGYGARFIAFSVTPPRDFRIQFTEPNSPASDEVAGLANFVRGARILEIDGVDLVNANSQAEIDTLNDGLFPVNAGEMHTFEMLDPGAGMSRTVMLTSADIAPKPVNRLSVINTATGDVGYILLNTFSPFASEQEIADAITTLQAAGVTDVILDLRYNGGGLLAVASQLGYMIAGDAPTAGKVYERLRFNAAAGNTNPVTGALNEPLPFIDTGIGFSLPAGTPLDTLNLPRVFVLSTGDTCSASESVINSLRGIDIEVILIGDTTCGKPFGFFPESNCGETYFSIQFQGVNDKDFGDYADGFIPQNSSATFGVRMPGCVVADDYDHELGDENEALLAAALQYRATGMCPAAPLALSALRSASPTGEGGSIGAGTATPINIMPDKDIYLRNRDMTMPN